jgi:hypothetical protein
MKIDEFKEEHVPGLYAYVHFAHESGAFIQAHVRGGEWMLQRADGTRETFWEYAALKRAVEG